jgi:hypothetical protein
MIDDSMRAESPLVPGTRAHLDRRSFDGLGASVAVVRELARVPQLPAHFGVALNRLRHAYICERVESRDESVQARVRWLGLMRTVTDRNIDCDAASVAAQLALRQHT